MWGIHHTKVTNYQNQNTYGKHISCVPNGQPKLSMRMFFSRLKNIRKEQFDSLTLQYPDKWVVIFILCLWFLLLEKETTVRSQIDVPTRSLIFENFSDPPPVFLILTKIFSEVKEKSLYFLKLGYPGALFAYFWCLWRRFSNL